MWLAIMRARSLALGSCGALRGVAPLAPAFTKECSPTDHRTRCHGSWKGRWVGGGEAVW